MASPLTEGWFHLSLPEQMVNIGNEVKRAIRFDSSSEKKRSFLDKALFYLDLTIQDPKNAPVVPELTMGKSVLEDYGTDQKYDCTKEQIRDYYLNFVYFL